MNSSSLQTDSEMLIMFRGVILWGAVPANDYKPAQPYTVKVSENPYSYQDSGYAKLYLQSGGADSPRPIQLRLAKDGKWYLWEQFLLAGIRPPESTNPWA